MPRHLGPGGGGPSCLGIWVPPDPKWGGTHMPVTPVLYATPNECMQRLTADSYADQWTENHAGDA